MLVHSVDSEAVEALSTLIADTVQMTRQFDAVLEPEQVVAVVEEISVGWLLGVEVVGGVLAGSLAGLSGGLSDDSPLLLVPPPWHNGPEHLPSRQLSPKHEDFQHVAKRQMPTLYPRPKQPMLMQSSPEQLPSP